MVGKERPSRWKMNGKVKICLKGGGGGAGRGGERRGEGERTL